MSTSKKWLWKLENGEDFNQLDSVLDLRLWRHHLRHLVRTKGRPTDVLSSGQWWAQRSWEQSRTTYVRTIRTNTDIGSKMLGCFVFFFCGQLYVTTQKTAKSRNVGINVYKDHVRGKGNGGGGKWSPGAHDLDVSLFHFVSISLARGRGWAINICMVMTVKVLQARE